MCDVNKKNIKIIDGIEYINILEIYNVLNVLRLESPTRSRQLLETVCSDFNITIVNTSIANTDSEEFWHFNLNEVKNAVSEAKAYYNLYYLPDELFKLVGPYYAGKKIKPTIETPEKYRRVLFRERFLYDRNDVDSLLNYLSLKGIDYSKQVGQSKFKNGQEYSSVDMVINILGIKTPARKAFKVLEKEWNVRTINVGALKYYNTDDIERVKKEITSFFQQHYMKYEVESLFPRNKIQDFAEPVRLERKYTRFLQDTYNQRGAEIAFRKSDIDSFFDNFNNNYYSKKEAMEVLNLSVKRFKEYRDEYMFRTKSLTTTTNTRYFKEDVEKILVKRQEYFAEYIDTTECATYFDNESTKLFYLNKLTKYSPPLYVMDKKMCKSGESKTFVYKRAEFLKVIEDYQKIQAQKKLADIYAETPYNTFLSRLSIFENWDGFDEQSIYTSKKWFNYVKGILDGTKRKGRPMNSLINQCVYCTVELKGYFLNFNNKKEIYLLTSQEMNIGLRVVTTYSNATLIYNFIREVFSDIIATGKSGAKAFRIEEIKTPQELWDVSTRNGVYEIYSFDVYSKVFDYCTNIEYHTQMSLNEINLKEKCIYASSWLYVILHMNNAWRNGDVKDFPRLSIEHILEKHQIYDISWFNTNKVTLPLARAIIYAVTQWELIISKTQLKGTFFCSDELAPALATAVILLTLYNNSHTIVQGESLMRFGTKFNDATPKMLATFFKTIDIDDFKFGSRKFNKTIMTYIYYIANLTGDSKALLYSMKLRGHINSETTLKSYIQLDSKMVEQLGKQLFARGEFGYIASLLTQRLHGGELSFEEITKEVALLNDSFGDLVKVNTTIGFMNSLRAEREQVFRVISEMPFQEIETLVTEIFARKAISKDSLNIQCLFSKKGCQRPDLEDKGGCSECPYHIPNIYALDLLCESIKKDIIKIQKTNIIPEKFKLSLAIEKKKIDILEAIKKYGKDYVYGCLGYSREEFICTLANIPKPQEISLSLSKKQL